MSSIKKFVKVTEGLEMPIACQSTVCEGDIARYTVDYSVIKQCNKIQWEVLGGEIVHLNDDSNIIDVLWKNVPENGFGIVKTITNNCKFCETVIKIPVIKQTGTIQGVDNICIGEETMLQMPQWPTTDFIWSIENASMPVSVIGNNQRNQIHVKADKYGSFELVCNYKNSLLNCTGIARKQIRVKPMLHLKGPLTACDQSSQKYQLMDNNNQPVYLVDWIVTGPNNFVQTGSYGSFAINFWKSGIYIFAITSPDFCTEQPIQIEVVNKSGSPKQIFTFEPVCPGTPVTYTCIAPSGSQTNWSVTNGTIIGSTVGNTVYINFNANATTPFVVSAWFKNDICSSEILNTTIPRITPNLTLKVNNKPVCSSSLAQYAIANQQAESYTWSVVPVAAGSIQSGQNTALINVLWNETYGTANLKLVLRKCGKDYTQLYPVEVIAAPKATLNLPATTVCNDTANSFSFNISPGTKFSSAVWDFGDGSPVTIIGGAGQTLPMLGNNTCTYTFMSPLLANATYTVTLVVRGANGCLNPTTVTKQIIVSPSPILTVYPTSLQCVDSQPKIFTINMQSGFAQTSNIQWYKINSPDIAISNTLGGNTPSLNVNQAGLGIGNYYAIVTNSNGCKKSTVILPYTTCTVNSYFVCYPYALGGTATWNCGTITVQNNDLNNPMVSYSWTDNSVTTPTINTPNIYVSNITTPGKYELRLQASTFVNGFNCNKNVAIPYTVPYKARLKYTVTCNGSSDGYKVTLLDASVYFPETPITNFMFQINGGAWQPANVVNNIAQLAAPNLPPGTHTVGIKIWRSATDSYAPCTATETLELPAYPKADFDIPSPYAKTSPCSSRHPRSPTTNTPSIIGILNPMPTTSNPIP